MFNGAQRASDERLVRDLFRAQYAEEGQEGPNSIQLERGLEMIEKVDYDEEVRKAIDGQIAKWGVLRGDELGYAHVYEVVRKELVRWHAEEGCHTPEAAAAHVTRWRIKRVAEAAEKRAAQLVGDEALGCGQSAFGAAPDSEDDMVDRLDDEARRRLLLKLSKGLKGRPQQVYVVLQVASDLSDERIAGCLPKCDGKAVEVGAVRRYRSEAALEMRAMTVVAERQELHETDKTVVRNLVAGIRHHRGEAVDLPELGRNARGKVKRLAEHLELLGL